MAIYHSPTSHSPTWYEVRAALKQTGCSICHVCNEDLQRFFFWLAHQNYYEPPMLERLRASAGLCRRHAWKLAELGCTYQMAAMYQYLVEDKQIRLQRLVATLERAASSGQRPWSRNRTRLALARREVQPAAACPACTDLAKTTEHALRELVRGLDDLEFRELLVESDGLCMPHFAQALEVATEREISILIEVQQARLEALRRDLAEYMRKVDYQFADEPKGDEQTAWRRAIALFAGPEIEWW